MPTNLSKPAVRGSNYQVTNRFRVPISEDVWQDIVPDTVSWTLRDLRGNIVNNRENVSIPGGSLAATITLVLYGDDLEPAVDGEAVDIDPVRILIWNATYTYDGVSGLPWRDWCRFILVDAP